MTMDTTSPVPPRQPPRRDDGDNVGGPAEARAFDGAEAPANPSEDAYRPQADFGGPISLDGAAGAAAAPGGGTPNGPVLQPRVERPLTVRIQQGMPSYAEPDPQIAGVVGRVAPDSAG